MIRLSIIWHSMTGGSEALAQAALMGAAGEAGVRASLIRAEEAGPESLLSADGYIFVFPENLAAISGAMKDFFDRSYYPCLGRLEGRPYALIVCAGSDGSNAVRQAERIVTGWRLRKVTDSRIVCTNAQTPEAIMAPKTIDEAGLETAHAIGASLAAGLATGIY